MASADVAALAAGIRAAVTPMVPDAGAALMERLPVTRRPEEEAHVLAEMLAADLTQWPAEAWLVFDEYQMIAGTVAAERFVESLLLEAPLNVLLTTRQRPTWASSRRILYGDVFEVDRAALAMTDEEARELLAGNGPETAEIVEVAQGGPLFCPWRPWRRFRHRSSVRRRTCTGSSRRRSTSASTGAPGVSSASSLSTTSRRGGSRSPSSGRRRPIAS